MSHSYPGPSVDRGDFDESESPLLSMEGNINCNHNVLQDECPLEEDLSPLIAALAEEERIEDGRGSEMFLYLASIMAAVGGITFGYDMGIISGAMLQLTDDLDLSSHQQEVVVSSMLMGTLIGSLVGGFFLDWYGRRFTVIGNTAVFVFGALVMSMAHSYGTLVFGRLVVGVAMVISGIGECIYVSEISPPGRRGSLVLLNETGICLGILTAYLINFIFITTVGGWRYMFLLSAVPAVVQAIGMYMLPASPRFLLMQGRDKEAHATLCKLRGTHHVQKEWDELKTRLHLEKMQNHRFSDLCSSKRNMRVRMLIASGMGVFGNLTGQTTVIYYAPTIFQLLGFSSDFTATLATVGLGFTKLLASIIALFTVDVAGRRQLLLLGGSIMTIVIAILGVVAGILPPANMTEADSTGAHTTYLVKVVAVLSLMLYVFAFSLGYGPVVWLLFSELFPADVRGRAASITQSMKCITNILISLVFLDVVDAISISSTFLIFAVICLFSVLYVYCYIPETKGRSLEDISQELSKRTYCNCLSRVPSHRTYRGSNDIT